MNQESFVNFLYDPNAPVWIPGFEKLRHHGGTALHWACKGQLGCEAEAAIKELVRLGCDKEALTEPGHHNKWCVDSRPLHVAAKQNNHGALKALLELGCTVGGVDGDGQTAMMLTDGISHRECRNLLMVGNIHQFVVDTEPERYDACTERSSGRILQTRLALSSSVLVRHKECGGAFVGAEGRQLMRSFDTGVAISLKLSPLVPDAGVVVCRCEGQEDARAAATSLSLPSIHAYGGALVPMQLCAQCHVRELNSALSCGHRCCSVCAPTIATCYACNRAVTGWVLLLN